MIKENKEKVSLVLSWWGARGLSHIGVIEEILEQGYEISSIVGTSMGALVWWIYALGKLPTFKERFCSLTRLKVLSFLDISYWKPWLIKGEKVFNKMKELGEEKNIEDLPIRYKAIATDLNHGKPYIFETWGIYTAIRASVSIPTVFTPLVKNGRILVDGGVLNNIPVAYAEQKEDELLMVVDVWAKIPSQIEEKPQEKKKESIYDSFIDSMKNKFEEYHLFQKDKDTQEEKKKDEDWWYTDVVQKSISVMMREISDIRLKNSNPDILVELSYENGTTFDFHRAEELIALGRKYAKIALDNYKTDNE